MKTDEHGEYRSIYRFIEAWAGKSTSPGWCLCEVREYAAVTIDGVPMPVLRVYNEPPQYVCDHPEHQELYAIYLHASRGLGLASDSLKRNGTKR